MRCQRSLFLFGLGQLGTQRILFLLQAEDADLVCFRSSHITNPYNAEACFSEEAPDLYGVARSCQVPDAVQSRSGLADIYRVRALTEWIPVVVQPFNIDSNALGEPAFLALLFPEIDIRTLERETHLVFAVRVRLGENDADSLLFARALVHQENRFPQLHFRGQSNQPSAVVHQKRRSFFLERPLIP